MAEESKQTRLTPLFAVAAALFGLAFVGTALQVYGQFRAIRTWIPVTGVVSRVSTEGWWDEKDHRRHYLEYSYTVDGREYGGVRYHRRGRSLKTYGGIQHQYNQGDPITVFYDPGHPGQAALNMDYLRDWFIGLTMLTGFLALAASVFIKEARDRNVVEAVASSYDGSSPLPNLPLVRDGNGALRLDTGPSLFWNTGIPFVFASFAGIVPGLFLLKEINPGWGLSQYVAAMAVVWALGVLACLAVRAALSYSLVIDSVKREVSEHSRVGFSRKVTTVPFSQVTGLRLRREKWRHDNMLRNWILSIYYGGTQSMVVSGGFRDAQTANSQYLGAVKMRIERLVFQS